MEKLYLIPSMPVVSIIILILLSMVFLFMASSPMHEAMNCLVEGVVSGFKKIADCNCNGIRNIYLGKL